MTTIGMLVFPEVQMVDLIGPLELLAPAPDVRTLLIAARKEPIVATSGVQLVPQATLEDAPPFDVLFVPGGAGIRHALADPATLAFLAERGDAAAYVTSVCTGALVLGVAGLLRGYRATTHWRFMDFLPAVGAIPVHERVVRDRNRITGGGATAGLDFGLALVAELRGQAVAERIQLALEYDPQPPFAAGHPRSAPAAAVERLQSMMQPLYDERARLIEAAVAR